MPSTLVVAGSVALGVMVIVIVVVVAIAIEMESGIVVVTTEDSLVPVQCSRRRGA